MPALGSEQRPVIVKVTSEKMAQRVAEICEKNSLQFIVGFEAIEDLTDLKKAIKEKNTPKNIYDPCPCGSGAKYKFCCAKKMLEFDIWGES